MNDIQVGDLVMVVKPKICCGLSGGIGKIFRVSGFFPHSRCGSCGKTIEQKFALLNGEFSGAFVVRLKKIPPLTELESQKETIHESA